MFVPRAYQLRSATWLLERPHAALFLDPGMGKTAITLSAIDILLQEKLTTGALIIAPLRPCYLVWPAEMEKWKDSFGHLRMGILHGKYKQDVLDSTQDIYVINPNSLEWLVDSGGLRALNRRGVRTLVMDEITMFKHSRTKRFKMWKKWLGQFHRRWGLTGTPASDSMMNLFGIMYMLDEGRRLGQYITHFRSRYFFQPPKTLYEWQLNPGAREQIEQQIADIALSLDAAEYLQIPKEAQNVIYVELPAKVRRMYRDFEDTLLQKLGKGFVMSLNAASAMNKCRQITSGAVFILEGQNVLTARAGGWEEIHDAKMEALDELIESLNGQQLFVAYEYTHELERFKKRYKGERGYAYMDSGLSMEKTARIESDWNESRIQVLFAQPQSVGHGLNMQHSHAGHICWFTVTHSGEIYQQFVKRVLRSGNKRAVVMLHFLIARGTVDQPILANARNKQATEASLMHSLREYAKSLMN